MHAVCLLAFENPPFRIQEEGWGEFEMQIVLSAADKDHVITHDLNFLESRYESKHVVVFKNPKPHLLAALKQSGPVPGEQENGTIKSSKRAGGGGGDESIKKKKKLEKNVCSFLLLLLLCTYAD